MTRNLKSRSLGDYGSCLSRSCSVTGSRSGGESLSRHGYHFGFGRPRLQMGGTEPQGLASRPLGHSPVMNAWDKGKERLNDRLKAVATLINERIENMMLYHDEQNLIHPLN